MNAAIVFNNAQHADNVAGLANALALLSSNTVDRAAVAALLMSFRHHEEQRRRARRSCGIDAPSPHTARQQALLSALRTMIISRMQQPAQPEEAIR